MAIRHSRRLPRARGDDVIGVLAAGGAGRRVRWVAAGSCNRQVRVTCDVFRDLRKHSRAVSDHESYAHICEGSSAPRPGIAARHASAMDFWANLHPVFAISPVKRFTTRVHVRLVHACLCRRPAHVREAEQSLHRAPRPRATGSKTSGIIKSGHRPLALQRPRTGGGGARGLFATESDSDLYY